MTNLRRILIVTSLSWFGLSSGFTPNSRFALIQHPIVSYFCIDQQQRLITSTTTRLHVANAPPGSVDEKNRHPTPDGENDLNQVAATLEQECVLESTSPAAEFGRPIQETTKNWNKKMVLLLKSVIFDTVFAGPEVERAFARFYTLETIARMPYFSYLSVLHLLEDLGLWRRAEYLRVHFAQDWNEMHHLMIMEELGGNKRWFDRFLAQHMALSYFWIVFAVYLFNETLAYNINQAIEEEAFDTYSNFLKEHEDYLKAQPAPKVAVEYYTGDDLYMFDKMQLDGEPDQLQFQEKRRPVCNTLYDTFSNIRDDEAEHVKTMVFLQREVC